MTDEELSQYMKDHRNLCPLCGDGGTMNKLCDKCLTERKIIWVPIS